jgi:hypothetical protein
LEQILLSRRINGEKNMSIDTTTLAQEIFVNWATQIGSLNWQWDDMAQAAFNAATRFAYIESIQPAQVPVATPDQTPVPTPAPTTPDQTIPTPVPT